MQEFRFNLQHHICSSISYLTIPSLNHDGKKPSNQKRERNTTDLDLKALLGHPAHHRRARASSAHQGGQEGSQEVAAGDSYRFWCRDTQLFP